MAGFRQVGIAGHYWAKFEIRVMPRKGTERVFLGEMAGSPDRDGPKTRILVEDPAEKGGIRRQFYFLQGAPTLQAWAWNAGERGVTAQRLEADRMLDAVQGTDLTLFDLQMPFLQWTDFVYEGVANVRGRPAHAFLLYPPQDFPARGPAAVRVYLDTQFGAMTQAEWVSAAGKTQKSVTVLDLKKIGEQWIVKSIDLRNSETRDKTRLTLNAAALDLPAWNKSVFRTDTVEPEMPVPPADRIERF